MLWCYKSTPVVTCFGPGVWIEQERLIDGRLWQYIKEITRITRIHTNVRTARFPDLAEQHCHAVDVRLTSDEADVRMAARLMNQVLAPSEPDLQPNRSSFEKRGEIQRFSVWIDIPIHGPGRERVQVFIDIGLLGGP